jgi:hypothetical protein
MSGRKPWYKILCLQVLLAGEGGQPANRLEPRAYSFFMVFGSFAGVLPLTLARDGLLCRA